MGNSCAIRCIEEFYFREPYRSIIRVLAIAKDEMHAFEIGNVLLWKSSKQNLSTYIQTLVHNHVVTRTGYGKYKLNITEMDCPFCGRELRAVDMPKKLKEFEPQRVYTTGGRK